MTYYPDLSHYSYFESELDAHSINIGWLDIAYPYTTKPTPAIFAAKLWNFCRLPVQQSRGFHSCYFCKQPDIGHIEIWNGKELHLGSAEIRVFGTDGIVYAAPDLIYHYVIEHHYHPPDAFIQAVLEGPQPGTLDYLALIKPWVNPYASPWWHLLLHPPGETIDESDIPEDPLLQQLEERVCGYAAAYRKAQRREIQDDPKIFVLLYHQHISQLYNMGWNGELKPECLLPVELMPDAYLRRHPRIALDHS